jgi:hypothetical protein
VPLAESLMGRWYLPQVPPLSGFRGFPRVMCYLGMETVWEHCEQSRRVRMLLGDLLADIQDCEEQLGTYAPLDA